jgi:allantoate deiminase
VNEPSVFPSAKRILERCDALARRSESPDQITRLFLSEAQRAASELVGAWMREAGMTVSRDAIGNLIGRYEGATAGLPALLLGSHLDTVRDAGRYDGVLGVVCAIECVDILHRNGVRKPFAIEVIGFADGEGARFRSVSVTSRAVAGAFDTILLAAVDRQGVTMREAIERYGLDPAAAAAATRSPQDILAYVELHIEQGPVLEAEGIAVAAVTTLNGASRFIVEIGGVAAHAETVPMNLRRDAIAGAAECILNIERVCSAQTNVVGTVGWIDAGDGAANVIPRHVTFPVDVRAASDELRSTTATQIKQALRQICRRRGLTLSIDDTYEIASIPCAPHLITLITGAISEEKVPVRQQPSAAGHDAAALAALTDVGMLFVRCKGGTSHNPDESVREEDVAVALHVMLRIIDRFRT